MRLWLAQVLGQSSNRVFQISVIWWMMTELKGASPGLFAAIFLVGCALPAVLLAKPIGRLVDRSAASYLMSAALVGAAFVLGLAGAFAWGLGPVAFLVMGVALSLVHAIFDPTLQRSLSHLVPASSVPTAVSIVTSTQSAANFGGAVLGAFLLEWLGLGLLLIVAASAYVASAALAFSLPLKAKPAPPQAASAAKPDEEWSLKEEYPLLARVLLGFGLVNFFATPILVILPLYVRQVLNGSAVDLGSLEAAVWIGLVAGTLLARPLTKAWSPLRTAVICLTIMGLAFGVPGLIAEKWVYQASLFIAGLALGANNTRFITLFQEAVEDRFKGRFFALLQAAVSFTMPISFLVFGFLGDRISPQWLCLVQGAGVIGLAGYFFWLEGSSLPVKRTELVAEAS